MYISEYDTDRSELIWQDTDKNNCMRYQTVPIKQATQHGIHDTPDSIKIQLEQLDYKQHRNYKITWILKILKIILLEDKKESWKYIYISNIELYSLNFWLRKEYIFSII